ncbi:MAG TPA: MJ0042-type zinc finger domain-containing protein, partial [Burkholderiaceae bacterium]|nr:MJ0042-type zinc finger domain-containing protein [Burkholderiaceae bacterium]
MALATRCPNCQALFRVVADQLKLRGGLVRCGACRHVFDAIGSLTYIEDSAAAAPDPTPKRKAAPPTLHASALATPVLRTAVEETRPVSGEASRDDAGPPTLIAADARAEAVKRA